MALQVVVEGSDVLDEIAKKEAIEKILKHASTDALEFVAEMVQRPNASKKLLAKKGMIKAFL